MGFQHGTLVDDKGLPYLQPEEGKSRNGCYHPYCCSTNNVKLGIMNCYISTRIIVKWVPQRLLWQLGEAAYMVLAPADCSANHGACYTYHATFLRLHYCSAYRRMDASCIIQT